MSALCFSAGLRQLLHRNSRAPILPAVLRHVGGGARVRLDCGDPIGLDVARDPSLRPLPEATVTAALYGQLERWLVDGPEQWTYLNAFPVRRTMRMPADA